MNKRDVAVIGIGYWGKNLVRNYYELQVLHTLCDLDLDLLAHFQEKLTDVQITCSFQQVLENPEIKKVVLAVPTRLHFSFAKQALMAGKDVFVEKAMCETLQEAIELTALAKKMNRILMIGHLLHYHPAIVEIKKIIQAGKLGDIYHYSFSRLNFGSKGLECSALWAFAPHDISILLSLAQDKTLASIDACHKSFFSNAYIDQSWLHFEFSNNLSADIHISWSHPYPERKFIAMGTKGSIMFDDLRDWDKKITIWNNSVEIKNGKINFNPHEHSYIGIEPKEPLREECLHFLHCCEHRICPLTDGQEGVRVMEVLEKTKELNCELAVR